MTIYAFKGRPLELWIDNLQLRDGYAPMTCESDDLEVYRLFEDRFRFFPTEVGDFSFTLRAAGRLKTGTIRVIEPMTGAEPTKYLAIIGDSGAGAGNGIGFPKMTKDILGDPLVLLGTRGDAPYKHDGDPGASFEIWRHDMARSVLLDDVTGAIDIPAYHAAIGGVPDAWLWCCLSNKIGNSTFELLDATIDAELDDLDDLIAAVDAVNPSAKHLIADAWPGNLREQCWIDVYAGNLNRWDWKRKHHRTVEKVFQRNAGREAERRYIVHTSPQIDTFSGYPESDPFHFVGLVTGGHGQAARAIAPVAKGALWP